ncbi:MAG: threonine dehydratase [Phreatobacter sp.]|uniref:threonine dehydratase n=1 Tax=Phreatobacter sp. TaxID=1966341 RepID=UPI002733E01E|nr:threonine dehydratase [Phreatobacter sp.]MDP2803553.1 threonine dehydratase [Phreatobacter sp.]
MQPFSLDELNAAHALVQTAMPPTPAFAWPLLAARYGCEVVVKHENHTPTGAFKVRGGLVYVDRLVRERPHVKGMVSATRGNHGQSLAFAARRVGLPVVIVVPHGNSVEKNAAMKAFGAELVEHGRDFDEARARAVEIAGERGYEFAASFQRDLVMGVGTYALELFTAHPDLDVVYVPIGLGSGICGVIAARDLLGLPTEVVAVVAENAPAYALSLAAGRVVETNDATSFADGMAVRIPSPEAFALIARGVARCIAVSEDAIAEAMRIYWTDTHNAAEGAGAAALAALAIEAGGLKGRKAGVILSGQNVDLPVMSAVLAGRTPAAA